MLDNLTYPNEFQFEAAHLDGLLNWHRKDKINPYIVSGEALSATWWYWDLGRREGAFMHGVALEKAAVYASQQASIRHKILLRLGAA